MKIWTPMLIVVVAVTVVAGCGKKDEAGTDSGAKKEPGKLATNEGVKSTPGKVEVPPLEKHKSESAPSPEMAGEWVIEPSERQRVINAQLVARGKKPQETTLKIEAGKFTLTTIVDPVQTTISGDAKQEGKKITLTATGAESLMDGKPIKSRIPEPQVFTLQDDQLTIKDSAGLVYVRK